MVDLARSRARRRVRLSPSSARSVYMCMNYTRGWRGRTSCLPHPRHQGYTNLAFGLLQRSVPLQRFSLHRQPGPAPLCLTASRPWAVNKATRVHASTRQV
ncbi:hypothetical protein E2C01_080392 [Portunus trituberculatus]|uniref:Uncharacterized protein n=1 Tax=Portunus trituberculatus TaxID=210409 RepID=A0A5B7IJL5_PORTR|nr:hypothetical protein [Portunus trituberculatus]